MSNQYMTQLFVGAALAGAIAFLVLGPSGETEGVLEYVTGLDGVWSADANEIRAAWLEQQ